MLPEVGQRLYHVLLGNTEVQAIIERWQKQPDIQPQISIQSNIPKVLSLPWELLHDGNNFLALHPTSPIPIVRRLSLGEQQTLRTLFEPPLRVLFITSRPEGTGFVDPRSIAHEMLDEVQAQVEAGTIEVEVLRPPTFTALRARLLMKERPIHVLHFDGHGVFDEEMEKQGVLFFENEAGGPSPIKASSSGKGAAR